MTSNDPCPPEDILGLQFKWTDELTRRFIQLRYERRFDFTGKRNSAKTAWEGIMQELGIDGLIMADQCRKKWSNLCQHYKDIKTSNRQSFSQNTWMFYDLMEQIMGEKDQKGNVDDAADIPEPTMQLRKRSLRSTQRLMDPDEAESEVEDSETVAPPKRPRSAKQPNIPEVEAALLRHLEESNRLMVQMQQSFIKNNDALLGAINRLTQAIINEH